MALFDEKYAKIPSEDPSDKPKSEVEPISYVAPVHDFTQDNKGEAKKANEVRFASTQGRQMVSNKKITFIAKAMFLVFIVLGLIQWYRAGMPW